jgi:hypothetical protein
VNETLDALIAELAPALAAAFLAAIKALRSRIDYEALVIALQARDIEAAIAALNIERGAFNRYVMERQSGFVQAGEIVSSELTKERKSALAKVDRSAPVVRSPVLTPPEPVGAGPFEPPPPPPASLTLPAPGGGNIVFSFEMTNPRAEQRIRDEAAARVAGYTEEQIATARQVIADGYQRGDGPQQIATDIAGRINPVSKRREGGIVGLSDPQVGYVDSMKRRLLSGDPDEMLKVLGRYKDGKWVPGTGMTLRDRRFDRSIMKAIRETAEGKPNPLTQARVDEMAAKYSDRLLARRAEDIARTETASGVEMARAEATRQAMQKDGLPDEALEKFWYHQGGPDDARGWHLAMHGKSVTGIDTLFELPDGSLMKYPHDPDGGAKNNANCRCRGDHKIDWLFGLLG